MGKIINCVQCGIGIDDNTKGKHIEDDSYMCKACSATFKDAAHMICKKCKKYISVMEAGVIKENGFEIKPNTVLHVDKCISCTPDVTVSSLLEVEDYLLKTGKKKK